MPQKTYRLDTKKYPRVRNNYQIHLWNFLERDFGILYCADNNREEPIVHDIAVTLRLMNGERRCSQIVTLIKDSMGVEYLDAESVLVAVLEQFVLEGIVEISEFPLPRRHFSLPLESPYQLKILQLQLTNRCNMSCPHCYADSGKPFPGEQKVQSILNLIDEFVDLGGCRLFLTGGETLLFDDLDAVISHAKSRQLFVYLSTNGFDVTEDRAEQLIKLGVGAVNVSIDGDNAKTHDEFRGRFGGYDKALKALKIFSGRGIPCSTQTTLFKSNLTQSEHIYDLMHAIGVRSSYFVRMMPQGRGKINDELIPTMEEYQMAREKDYLNRRLHYGMDVYPKCLSRGANKNRCSAGVSKIYVRADGCCYPCPSLEIEELFMGKYGETALSEIWNNRRKGFLELRRFGLKDSPACKSCKHYQICKGGCAGNAYHVTGDWRNPDPHFCVTMDIRERVQKLSPACITAQRRVE